MIESAVDAAVKAAIAKYEEGRAAESEAAVKAAIAKYEEDRAAEKASKKAAADMEAAREAEQAAAAREAAKEAAVNQIRYDALMRERQLMRSCIMPCGRTEYGFRLP